MASSNFVDSIRVFLRSGNGGAGAVHFRRTRFNPKGGPDGGNGGRGGSIVVVGDAGMNTLLHLRFRKHIVAKHGQAGGANGMDGAAGKDVVLRVPLGSIVKKVESGEVLAEITKVGERKCIAQGGRGGLGNAHFKSATRQAPKFAQPGARGVEIDAIFELKLMADVGMVGQPNAGKSTLLSVLSAARPEIGDYPFTTLRPQLGVVSYYDEKSFVMADIPGLLQGASKGKGLGIQFLRHIERCRVLLYMIPVDDHDIMGTYAMLQNEVKAHGIELNEKRQYLALTKGDLLSPAERDQLEKTLDKKLPYLIISSKTGEGIAELKRLLWEMKNDDLRAR